MLLCKLVLPHRAGHFLSILETRKIRDCLAEKRSGNPLWKVRCQYWRFYGVRMMHEVHFPQEISSISHFGSDGLVGFPLTLGLAKIRENSDQKRAVTREIRICTTVAIDIFSGTP